MTHTPGPWYAVDNGYYIYIKIGDNICAPSVADVCASKFLEGGDNSKANAALIAAAPELLQALKMAQLWLDIDGRYDMQAINAAIAKAEGRS